jgi:hypothetical protein
VTEAAKPHRKKSRRCKSLFSQWVNHNISRRLVDKAKRFGKALVLETSGARQRFQSRGALAVVQLGLLSVAERNRLQSAEERRPRVAGSATRRAECPNGVSSARGVTWKYGVL